MKFVEINRENYPQVEEIYATGIATGTATFETKAPNWESWNLGHLAFGRIAIEEEGTVAGWAALSPVSSRCVYGGVAEVSVYVHNAHRGKGIGKQLLDKLVESSEQNGIWTLQAGIMPANKASIQLHLKCGFRKIGYRERIGQLKGQWLDNIILERRSKVVGV